MLNVVVVDNSAENRLDLMNQVSDMLRPGAADSEFLPRISLNSLSPQELRFNSAPDICIVGKHCISRDIGELGNLKKLLPYSAFIAQIDESYYSIAHVEQLARYGADDVICSATSAKDFIRKLVLLSQKSAPKRSGRIIIVDSGKGGLGVTSLVAGCAEGILERGHSVACVDLDFASQDLSRFLQARPFINENLQGLLAGNKPVTQEFVSDCLVEVWHEEKDFVLMSPPPEADALYETRSNYASNFSSVIQALAQTYSYVVVDSASVRGAILRSLYRNASDVIFTITNDAASLYASVQRLQQLNVLLSPDAKIRVVLNAPGKHGVSRKVYLNEFSRALNMPELQRNFCEISFCATAQRWPGSLGTVFSQGSSKVRGNIAQLLDSLNVDKLSPARDSVNSKLLTMARSFVSSSPNEKLLPALPESTSEKIEAESGGESGNSKTDFVTPATIA